MATLSVTHTEAVTLNDREQGGTKTYTVASIADVMKRTVACTASQTTTVAVFNDTVHGAAGAIDAQNSKYIRVTNLDSSNSIELAIVGAATLYQVKLAPGESHVLGSADDLMLAEADTSPSFGTMADIASIQVNPGGNAVAVEVFVASTV
jgi:hypothetical protein|tara:strand:- start:1058 stop:1507 length:450 start_codon:yes stop_codon:yes gene_type:complete